jgi:hypothetical protein
MSSKISKNFTYLFPLKKDFINKKFFMTRYGILKVREFKTMEVVRNKLIPNSVEKALVL